MPTECSPDFFGFEPVEERQVMAAFDGGAITSGAYKSLVELRAACMPDAARAVSGISRACPGGRVTRVLTSTLSALIPTATKQAGPKGQNAKTAEGMEIERTLRKRGQIYGQGNI